MLHGTWSTLRAWIFRVEYGSRTGVKFSGHCESRALVRYKNPKLVENVLAAVNPHHELVLGVLNPARELVYLIFNSPILDMARELVFELLVLLPSARGLCCMCWWCTWLASS